MRSKVFDITNKDCISFVQKFKTSEDFIVEFRNKFERILAYHATNLSYDELNSIRREGLQLANKELLLNLAKARFVNELNTDNENDKILEAINNFILKENVVPEIYFNVSKNELLTQSGHYLKYGSETLVRLAQELEDIVN